MRPTNDRSHSMRRVHESFFDLLATGLVLALSLLVFWLLPFAGTGA